MLFSLTVFIFIASWSTSVDRYFLLLMQTWVPSAGINDIHISTVSESFFSVFFSIRDNRTSSSAASNRPHGVSFNGTTKHKLCVCSAWAFFGAQNRQNLLFSIILVYLTAKRRRSTIEWRFLHLYIFFFFSSLIASYVRPSFIRMWCVHTIRIQIYDVVGGIRWSRTCCWTMKMLLSGRRMAYIIIPATQKYVVFFFNLQQNVLTMMVQYLKLRLLASEPTRVFEREKQKINGEGKGAKKWLVPDYCS